MSIPAVFFRILSPFFKIELSFFILNFYFVIELSCRICYNLHSVFELNISENQEATS